MRPLAHFPYVITHRLNYVQCLHSYVSSASKRCAFHVLVIAPATYVWLGIGPSRERPP